MISLNPGNLSENPDLVPLLAILQERDNFDVDSENEVIKPVHEEHFLSETLKNVENLSCEHPEIKIDECKEVIGSIKNQLLESVKLRWIKSDRRQSIGGSSIVSCGSKRDREEATVERNSRQRRSSSNNA